MGDLIQLCREMSDLTEPKCAQSCRAPHSCCDPMYCEIAIEYAAESGETLQRTDHPTLPLMGPTGCVVAPHLRPLCTLHVCSINGVGHDKDPVFTEKYFVLRDAICVELELKNEKSQ